MTLDNIAIPLLAFLLVFNSVYFSLKNGSLKPQHRNELIIGLVIFGFSIWYEMDRSDKIETLQTTNNTLDTNINSLLSKRKVDSINIDSSQQIIKKKIDSVKVAISDSIKIGTQNTISVLQNTIREQSKALDSLGRLHAEKHLSIFEKNDILTRINKIEKENNLTDKEVSISMATNSNGGAFSAELSDFLNKKGYRVFPGTTFTTGLQYYIVTYNMGRPTIIVGVFKL